MRALFIVLLSLTAHADKNDTIVARNIFCSGCGPAKPTAAPPTAELISTLVCPRDPLWSRALVRDLASGEMHLFGPGDLLSVGSADRVGAARLTRVTARWIELSSHGRNWRLFLEAPPAAVTAVPPPSSRCEGGRCTLDRADVERMVTHPELLAARATATPDGFIVHMGPASPLRKLGLKDGDKLRAIDGTVLDGVDALMHLWPKLRRASRFSVSLMREGQPLTFEVSVNQ